MEREIRVMEDLSSLSEEWDAYVAQQPEATFFHGMGWQRVIDRCFSYRPVRLAALEQGKITGVLPAFVTPQLPFGRAMISAPLAVYGGIAADDEATRQALLAEGQKQADARRVRYFELRNVEPVGDMPVKELYVTFRREISADHEENLAAIPRKQRRMVRQGAKKGLTSQIGGAEFLDGFYDIYSGSVRNLGTPVFPKKLFRSLLEEFGEACKILAVFHEGKMVAGVMTFFFRDQVLPYYGGALKEAFKLTVNDFMYWELMCHAADNGYRIFDFGRSKQDTGPYRFKRHWGFEPEPLNYQYHLVTMREMPDMSPKNPKFSVAIELWKKMPLRLTQWIGPSVVRYFP